MWLLVPDRSAILQQATSIARKVRLGRGRQRKGQQLRFRNRRPPKLPDPISKTPVGPNLDAIWSGAGIETGVTVRAILGPVRPDVIRFPNERTIALCLARRFEVAYSHYK